MILVGCKSEHNSSNTPLEISSGPNISVQILQTDRIQVEEQVVNQNNCGGSSEVENTTEKSRIVEHIINVEGEYQLTANGEVGLPGTNVELGVAVASSLGYSYGTSESITKSIIVKAQPGTNMAHRIKLVEIWDTGVANIKIDDQEFVIPFRFRRDFDVELIESTNLGDCLPSNTNHENNTVITETILPNTPEPTATTLANTCEQIIDFELVGGGVPIEGLPISNQFQLTYGVVFSLESGGSPVIADVGGNATAFGSDRGNDMPLPGQKIGDFFLTDDGELLGLETDTIIITFNPPTVAASGDIIDIDFGEEFNLQIFDGSGLMIESIFLTEGMINTGDGLATPWSFQLSDGLQATFMRITGARTESGHFGFGFDNFSPRAVCP